MAYDNAGPITLTAGEALAINRLVKLDSSGNAVYADAADNAIGVTTRPAASAELVPVMLLSNVGAFKVCAAGAIAVGAAIYAAADGKVNDVDGGVLIGHALQAATGDGHVITVSYTNAQVARISFTITSTEAALNSNNGQYSHVTGWGAAPSAVSVMVLTTSTLLAKTAYAVDITTTPGTIIVKGVAAGTQLDAGDIVHIIAAR